MDDASDQQVDDRGHIQREEAVAQQADALEEGDVAAKKLTVDGDDSPAYPDNAEDDFKKQGLVVGIRGDAQYGG